MVDENNYPTQQEIDLLKMYSGYEFNDNGYDFEKLLELLKSIWWAPDWGFKQYGDKIELHTGGWSGNEEIIEILRKSLFWVLYWEKSERGGHYYFSPVCSALRKESK